MNFEGGVAALAMPTHLFYLSKKEEEGGWGVGEIEECRKAESNAHGLQFSIIVSLILVEER